MELSDQNDVEIHSQFLAKIMGRLSIRPHKTDYRLEELEHSHNWQREEIARLREGWKWERKVWTSTAGAKRAREDDSGPERGLVLSSCGLKFRRTETDDLT